MWSYGRLPQTHKKTPVFRTGVFFHGLKGNEKNGKKINVIGVWIQAIRSVTSTLAS